MQRTTCSMRAHAYVSAACKHVFTVLGGDGNRSPLSVCLFVCLVGCFVWLAFGSLGGSVVRMRPPPIEHFRKDLKLSCMACIQGRLRACVAVCVRVRA